MKIVLALIACMLACAQTASADGLNIRKQIGFYQEHALFTSAASLKRCTALLRASLTHGTRDDADERMRRQKCFDDFSGLSDARFLTQKEKSLPPSQAATLLLFDKTVLVRIASFDYGVSKLLGELLTQAPPQRLAEADMILIDVRGNGGGYITELRDVLAYFAPGAGSYMATATRCDDVEPVQVVKKRGVLGGKRYTILVDRDTMSAAEWFTAQMRYGWYDGSTSVDGFGVSRTFGKAIMQIVNAELGMLVTCGQWEYPHHPVQGVGIPVDKELDQPKECGFDIKCALSELGITGKQAIAGSR